MIRPLTIFKARTSLDMDGTLPLIFPNSLTTQDIITKISAFLQLTRKWILNKFGGRGSKNGPTMPIRSFRGFWQEIQIFGTLETSNFLQGGFLSRLTTGENLVLISQTTFEIFKIRDFFSSKCPPLGKKKFLKIIFFPSGGHLEEKNL